MSSLGAVCAIGYRMQMFDSVFLLPSGGNFFSAIEN